MRKLSFETLIPSPKILECIQQTHMTDSVISTRIEKRKKIP